MAKMMPYAIDNFKTESEKRVYEMLRSRLSDEYTVFYGRMWTMREYNGMRDVEVDFIITKPNSGILVLEVKGGTWERKGGQWTCYGNLVSEKDDPFYQGRVNKASLVDLLRGQVGWRDTYFPVIYAVMLPDTEFREGTNLSGLPPLIQFKDLPYLDIRVEELMHECLHINYPAKTDLRMIDHLTQTLMRDYVVRVGEILRMDEERLLLFTEQQLQLDKQLRNFKRLTIQGCAGSGKTLMAIRQVRNLASKPGIRSILLTCFNRELGQWLAEQTKDLGDKCTTMPVLDLFATKAMEAGIIDHIDEKDTKVYEELPALFLEANDLLGLHFDAIVVDEGQSFKQDWWDVLLGLLSDKDQSNLAIFYDDLQRIYQEVDYPIPGENSAVELTYNLRNTAAIHRHATKHLPKEKLPDCNPVSGEPVWVHTYADTRGLVNALRKTLRLLVTEGGVSIKDIILLTPKRSNSALQPEMKIGNYVISKYETDNPAALRMTTIQSFRGMERKVVILAELDARVDALETLNYLGASRARTKLVLLVNNDLPEDKRDVLLRGCIDITGSKDVELAIA